MRANISAYNNPNRRSAISKPFYTFMILVMLVAVVLQSCNFLEFTKPTMAEDFVLKTHNGQPLDPNREVGLLSGTLKLGHDGSITRKLDHRMQDGFEIQNINEGTYELAGYEIKITFRDPSGYHWTPPNAEIQGDTLLFYNPCVNCLGFNHEERYVNARR